MNGEELDLREQAIEQYTPDVEKLVRYLSWLKKQTAETATSYYDGEGKETLLQIPVFDSTLLNFVKEAEKTQFMTKNYPYVYSRFRIRSHEDEIRLMRTANVKDIDIFKGILSKYVLEGKRRPSAWRDAISENIFVTAVECLDEIVLQKVFRQG